MTPRASVKTTLATETRLRASSPTREPHFCVPSMFDSLEVKVLFTA
jgi:hypothetical protein